jgi:hypothetical protein
MMRALLSDRTGDLFTATATQDQLAIGVISNRTFEKGKGIQSTKDGMLAVDGVLHGSGDLESLTKHDRIALLADQINGLRGSFVIALWKRDALTLFTDHFSTRPLYFMQVGGALYFSSELKALLPVGDRKHADTSALREAFALGYVCGSKTLVKEIKRLGPGGYLEFTSGEARVKLGSYYSAFDHRKERGEDALDLISRGLHSAVGQAVNSAKRSQYGILATLSAGLDSRVVSALASEFSEAKVNTLTYGEPDSLEVDLAERVAEALDSVHSFIPYNGGHWLLENLDGAVIAGEGMTHVIDTARMLHVLKAIDAGKFGMLHTGISGDFVFGSFIQSSDLERASQEFSPEDLGSSIPARLGMGHWDGLTDLIGEAGEGESFILGLQASVMRTFDPALLDRNWVGAHEQWNLLNRQIRGISGYFRGIEQSMEFATAFYDPDLAAIGLGLPDTKRFEQTAYVKVLRNLLPMKLQSLPWQKTGLPIDAGARSTGAAERLRRAIRRRISVKVSDDQWRRSSANPYQYWFAKDRKLREQVRDELVFMDRMPLLGLDRARFQSYLDRWLDDPKPYGRSLLHLIYLLPIKRWIDRHGASIEF